MKRKLIVAFLHGSDLFLLSFLNISRALSYVLPYRAMKAIYKGLGLAFFHFVPQARNNLIKTISTAMPEIGGEKEVAEMAKRTCCEAIFATFDLVMYGRHKEKFRDNLKITGLDNYLEAKNLKKGAIAMGCHLGSYSLSLAVTILFGVYFSPIAYDPESTTMPRFVNALFKYATSLGCDFEQPFFPTGHDTARLSMEHVRKGKNLGMMVDVGGSRIVELFGRPASIASGIAHFVIDTGAPILPANIYRGKKPYELNAVIWPMLKYELTGNRNTDIQIIMNEVAKSLEKQIRYAPEQWTNWFGLGLWWKKAERALNKTSETNS